MPEGVRPISHKGQFTQFERVLAANMVARASENPSYCGSQTGKAKLPKPRLVARLVRQAEFSHVWHHVSCQVRRCRDLHPAAKPMKLSNVITADRVRLWTLPRMCSLPLMLRGRVSESCGVEVADVENGKVFKDEGKPG